MWHINGSPLAWSQGSALLSSAPLSSAQQRTFRLCRRRSPPFARRMRAEPSCFDLTLGKMCVSSNSAEQKKNGRTRILNFSCPVNKPWQTVARFPNWDVFRIFQWFPVRFLAFRHWADWGLTGILIIPSSSFFPVFEQLWGTSAPIHTWHLYRVLKTSSNGPVYVQSLGQNQQVKLLSNRRLNIVKMSFAGHFFCWKKTLFIPLIRLLWSTQLLLLFKLSVKDIIKKKQCYYSYYTTKNSI